MMTAHVKPASSGVIPYGLMSLYDMINGSVLSLPSLFAQLKLYQILLHDGPQLSGSPYDVVPQKMRDDVRGWMRIAGDVAKEFEVNAVHGRIQVIQKALDRQHLRYVDISTEMRVLLEIFIEGFRGQLIFRYPSDHAKVLMAWKEDWQPVVDRFPQAAEDARSGVDLWCLGHSNASVFQFMRVLEHGLRALADDVGMTMDVQTWQNVIDQIEAKIKELGKSLPRGSAKTERLRFLSEAAKEFSFFKDGWRNHVSHGRTPYDKHQARSVMEHVRQFMTILASGLPALREEVPFQ